MAIPMKLQPWAACCVAVTVLMLGNCILASPDPLKCENIKCPPMSEISCPEDSQLREYIDVSSAETTNGTSAEIDDELLHECCVALKCSCKLCNIPSCQNSSSVIYEIIPETQVPGRCCGEYECKPEPNCTEIHDTEGYWLTDCQRCKCAYDQKICHRSCDEAMPNPTTYCKSESLNRFFSHGETWKDGCYECECQNGEPKCLIPLCRSLNCPHEEQVTLTGDCCPVCWPSTHHGGRHDSAHGYYDETENHDEEAEDAPLAPLAPTVIVAKPITTTTTTTTTTQVPPPAQPCVVPKDTSATYVEVVQPPTDERIVFYNVVIATLSILVVVLIVIIYHMRARKHSYNTVSNFDDNFNNCQKTSLKIEKSGELV